MSKLYVGNLPWNATEAMLEEIFQAANLRVESVKLVRDMDTGQPRGFAFVELEGGADIQKAIQDLNGQSLGGRPMVVNEARPQRTQVRDGSRRFGDGPRRSGGGGGRGHGGGRGGRRRF
jgi:cold-inducible RNA-binding protein